MISFPSIRSREKEAQSQLMFSFFLSVLDLSGVLLPPQLSFSPIQDLIIYAGSCRMFNSSYVGLGRTRKILVEV